MKYQKLKMIRKKDAKKTVIVENNVSIKEAVSREIEALYEKHQEREIYFNSVAINEKMEDYAVELPVPRKDFKTDFFIYWGNMSDLIAMRIEIEQDSVVIIKKQFEKFA